MKHVCVTPVLRGLVAPKSSKPVVFIKILERQWRCSFKFYTHDTYVHFANNVFSLVRAYREKWGATFRVFKAIAKLNQISFTSKSKSLQWRYSFLSQILMPTLRCSSEALPDLFQLVDRICRSFGSVHFSSFHQGFMKTCLLEVVSEWNFPPWRSSIR